MTRYSFVPARPDYPVASVAYFSSAALKCCGQPKILSACSLQRPCPHRADHRQAQELQADRLALRENRTELRLLHLPRFHLYLGEIRPHGLTICFISAAITSPLISIKLPGPKSFRPGLRSPAQPLWHSLRTPSPGRADRFDLSHTS